MYKKYAHSIVALSAVLVIPTMVAAQELDRTILPIPDPVRPPITEVDARKATAPKPFKVETPEGAPNVVIVLLDDLGI